MSTFAAGLVQNFVLGIAFVTGYQESGSNQTAVFDAFETCRRTGLPCARADYGPYTGTFLIDTAAEATAAFGPPSIFKDPQKIWKVDEIHATFVVGSGPVRLIRNMPISALGESTPSASMALIEEHSNSTLLPQIDGALGLPQLTQLRLQIDIVNNLVAADPRQQRPEPTTVRSPLERDVRTKFCVEVTVTPASPVLLPIDTGGTSFLCLKLSELRFYQRLGIAIPANKVTISTATEIREVQTWILKSVTISGFTFLDVPVLESNFNAIGMGCFSHFDMVLDFPKNEMWLTPHSDDWPKRVAPDASGLVLGFLNTNVLKLLRMQPDSAASKSELQIDDQILLFDGKEPKDISMWEIQQRVTKAGTKLPLRIRRGEQELDIQLPLSYSFEYPPKWSDKKNELEKFEEFLEKE